MRFMSKEKRTAESSESRPRIQQWAQYVASMNRASYFCSFYGHVYLSVSWTSYYSEGKRHFKPPANRWLTATDGAAPYSW
jgi:hypothetical protein